MDEELPSYLIEQKEKAEILKHLDEKLEELKENIKFIESSDEIGIGDKISRLNRNLKNLNNNVKALDNHINEMFSLDKKMLKKLKKD